MICVHKLAVIIYFLEGRGVGDTHITGRHLGGGTHITSDMCAGVHISRGYTYHCDTATSMTSRLAFIKLLSITEVVSSSCRMFAFSSFILSLMYSAPAIIF